MEKNAISDPDQFIVDYGRQTYKYVRVIEYDKGQHRGSTGFKKAQ